VFTPAGEIMKLPYGSTVIDFAYAVHTDVGNTCIDAKVDRQVVPLRTVLHNGQTVEIVTVASACPSPAWLNFVVTAKARSNIRHYQKNLKREEAVELGRRMLDRALGVFEVTAADISEKRLQVLLKDYHLKTLDDLLVEVGMGRRPSVLVARALVPSETADSKDDDMAMRPLVIKGTEGMVMRFSKCCRPIPGDPVIGIITGGRGLMIHAQSCRNIADRKYPKENTLDVQWEPGIDEEFPVEVSVIVEDRRGVLARVATAIGDADSNIENVGIEERDGLTNKLQFTITVHNRQHLARVMRRVRNIPAVIKITRTRG
jgi:(p)ppGpp synthase/HD superfamily hydrolase